MKTWVEYNQGVWYVFSGEHEADVGELGRAYSEKAALQFAAAQDLLSALKELVKLYDHDEGNTTLPQIIQAHEAIAKAEDKSGPTTP